ncbi:hypothetical protein GCM10028778_15820 [Barrientosiimonas marina]|uniref:DUF4064 domain-containing protein n=1 Tax=Lentibacillus kimchii TaxID=1542911 RepID=A0ABW2UVH7_9BACI
MKTSVHTIIVILSVCSIVLLIAAFIFLSSIGPLEQNKTANTVVTDILSKDPKAQRDNVDTAPLAADILSYLNQYAHYPLILIGFSVVLNGISLALLRSQKHLSGIFLICAAVASFFTLIPAVLQAVSGIYLIKRSKFNVHAADQ